METGWVCRCGRLWFPITISTRSPGVRLSLCRLGYPGPPPDDDLGCGAVLTRGGDDLAGVVSLAAHTPLPYARIPT